MSGASRVLIVEDSEDVVLALQVVMEAGGHEVHAARSCEEALTAARAQRIDVMLLDLTLPDGDGLDVLRELHESGHAPRATLALTGRDEPDVHARCRAAGCDDVLVKPVPMRRLMERVAAVIG